MSLVATMDDATRAQGIDLLERAFAEDLGPDGIDLTAPAVRGTHMRAVVVARQHGVACGLELAVEAFSMRGVSDVRQLVEDGATVAARTDLITVEGDAAAILSAERTALNVVQRLAGVATLTRRFVDAVEGTGASILDTRKTQPGLRLLQRYAVRCGGGVNHRFGLYDEAMLKDNHIAASGSIADALARVRESRGERVRVHVEADTLEQAGEAAAAGADVVLLDNMTNDELRRAVALIGDRALTEASGGVTLETVAEIARTGVDRIAIGALTHSAPAFDAALDAVIASA
jgi:nicotinate-nucleotide pyrophosphorylase (carboxylating)